jgi:hypothetical protein
MSANEMLLFLELFVIPMLERNVFVLVCSFFINNLYTSFQNMILSVWSHHSEYHIILQYDCNNGMSMSRLVKKCLVTSYNCIAGTNKFLHKHFVTSQPSNHRCWHGLLCKIQLDLFAPAGLETYAVRTLN